MLEQVAELVGLDDPQVDRDPGVGAQPDAARRRRACLLDEVELGGGAGQRERIGRGGDHVEVLDGVGHAPRRPRELDLLGGGVGAQRRDQRLADRERAAEHDAGRPLAGAL